jgi:hydrogenase maturation protease
MGEQPRILVAGIGNIFLGDDAFGSEVAQRLLRRPWPPEVRVVDFGIRGLDLAYALLDNYDTALLIDAAPRGEAPGTLYVLELPAPDGSGAASALQPHGLDPVQVLRLAGSLGSRVRRVLLVGCEPASANADEMEMDISAPVRAAVAQACELIPTLIDRLLAEIPLAECPAGECPAGECPAGECPAGECPAGECPAGECPAGEHANS